MQNIVVHIPHAGIKTPCEFKERLIVDDERFKKENILLSDYLIDYFKPNNHLVVSSKYSRMYCDVERFKVNEVMEKYGMGIIYKKDSNGKAFINLDDKYEENVLKYYDNYHDKLNSFVKTVLDKYGTCLLLDLHSFSDEVVYKLFNKTSYPDICIGFNKEEYNLNLVSKTANLFLQHGYTVGYNNPYSGSIVPSKYLGKRNTGISSIMIEVNKRVYLNDTNDGLDSTKTIKLKRCFDELYPCI